MGRLLDEVSQRFTVLLVSMLSAIATVEMIARDRRKRQPPLATTGYPRLLLGH